MTQGLYVNGQRPKSKKAVKEAVAAMQVPLPDPFTAGALVDSGRRPTVRLEATSLFGNEYDGSVADAPDGRYYFVGPDPYNKRNFYGTIEVRAGKVTVS